MTIVKAKKGKEVTLALKGELTVTTVRELDPVLEETYEGTEKLILDLTELKYVSSAGLRSLLSAQKRMGKGNLIIRNPNEIVMEVMTATGFTKIMTIE